MRLESERRVGGRFEGRTIAEVERVGRGGNRRRRGVWIEEK